MSFFSRIGNILKKQESAPASEHVALNEIVSFLESRNAAEIEEANSEVSRLKDSVSQSFRELDHMLDAFSKVQPKEKRATASAHVKNTFCERARKAILMIPEKEKPAPVFSDDCRHALDEINSATPRQLAHMDFFFREHAGKIAAKMREIYKMLDEIDETVSTSILSDIKKIGKMADSVKQDASKIVYFDKNIGEIRQEMDDMKQKEQKRASRIPGTGTGVMHNIKVAISGLENSKKEIRQEIETEFGPIKKLMKKYNHVISDKAKKKLSESYASSASDAMIHNDSGMEIRNLLAEIKSMIDRNQLDADERKAAHIGSLLSNMEHFKRLVSRHGEIDDAIRQKEAELKKEESIAHKADSIRSEIRDMKGRIAELRKMKDQLESTKEKLIGQINEKIRDIEFEASSLMGFEIKIDYKI